MNVDALRTTDTEHVGIDAVACTSSIVSIEVEAVEGHIGGTLDGKDIVAGVGGIVGNFGIGSSSDLGGEANRVGWTGTHNGTESNLFVEHLFAQTESDSTCHTGVLDGIHERGKVGILAAEAGTDDILTTAETDVDGTDNCVVGWDAVARNIDDRSDSVTAGSERNLAERNDTIVAEGQVVGIASGLCPCVVVYFVSEDVLKNIDMIIASIMVDLSTCFLIFDMLYSSVMMKKLKKIEEGN